MRKNFFIRLVALILVPCLVNSAHGATGNAQRATGHALPIAHCSLRLSLFGSQALAAAEREVLHAVTPNVNVLARQMETVELTDSWPAASPYPHSPLGIEQEDPSLIIYLSPQRWIRHTLQRLFLTFWPDFQTTEAHLFLKRDDAAPIHSLGFGEIILKEPTAELRLGTRLNGLTPHRYYRCTYEEVSEQGAVRILHQIDVKPDRDHRVVQLEPSWTLTARAVAGTSGSFALGHALRLVVTELDEQGSPNRIVFESTPLIIKEKTSRPTTPHRLTQLTAVASERMIALGLFLSIVVLFSWLLVPFMVYCVAVYRQPFYIDDSRLIYKDGKLQLGRIYKFLSLHPNTKEPILGTVGRFLRRGLDETPQLPLVMFGRWSLIGPRGLRTEPYQLPGGRWGFNIESVDSARYNGAKPGMINTHAAISGRGRRQYSTRTREAYDRFDAENISFRLASRILWRAFLAILWNEGDLAYNGFLAPPLPGEQWERPVPQELGYHPYRPKLRGLYIPDVVDSRYGQDYSVVIRHGVTATETRSYRDYLGPFYRDVNDFVSTEQKSRLVARTLSGKRQTLAIGLPTIRSASYIGRTLEDLRPVLEEFRRKYPLWEVELIIGINGPSQEDIVESCESFRHVFEQTGIRMTLLQISLPGKERAMNTIAQYVREKEKSAETTPEVGSVVLNFIDDDVHFRKGAIAEGVDLLLEGARQGHLPFVGHPYSVYPSSSWWGQLTARVREGYNPRFVGGPFLLLLAETYPMMPSYLVVDDLYLNLYFLDAADLSRILHPAPGYHYHFPTSWLRDTLQFTRTVYAHIQISTLMPEKYREFRGIRTAKYRRDAFEGISISFQKLTFLLAACLYYGNRRLIIMLLHTEIKIRQLIGLPRQTIHYRSDDLTKPLPWNAKSLEGAV